MSSHLTITAPAKINLVLRVVGSRPDGYHDLVMVMEKLALADAITLTTIPSGIELAIDGQRDQGMEAEKNLAWRAGALFKKTTGDERGVRIALTKRVPVAAGLGGGSSDAAAVIKGLNRLWERGLSNNELAVMGVKLGADVPFFCYDGSALVEGIGDRVTPIANLPKLYILLINPGFAVPTPWVYQEWDKQQVQGAGCKVQEKQVLGLTVEKSDAKAPRLFEAFQDVTAHLANDLEPVTMAAYPQVSAIKKYLLDAGAEGALMSGSGPTVFGLFSSKDMRDRAAAGVTSKDWKVFATEN